MEGISLRFTLSAPVRVNHSGFIYLSPDRAVLLTNSKVNCSKIELDDLNLR